MLTHGYPKFQKIISGDLSFGDPLGIGQGLSLYLAVFAEFFCSIFLLVGFISKPSTIFLMITMVTAAFIVHGGDGIAKQEKALLFLITYITLFLTGPGKFSIDQVWIGNIIEKRLRKKN
jgi:putative oxidoreductase